MEFFGALNNIRNNGDIAAKYAQLAELEAGLQQGTIKFDAQSPVDAMGDPSFIVICKIVHGSEVPKRRNLGGTEGRIIFIHALAHIEYSAIDLALDSAYRFRGMPPQYYEDWFGVALDEARHFKMLK